MPPALIPFTLAVGGAVFNTIATWLGVEGVPADGAMLTDAAGEGLLVGAAATSLHQIWKQARTWLKKLRAKAKAKNEV